MEPLVGHFWIVVQPDFWRGKPWWGYMSLRSTRRKAIAAFLEWDKDMSAGLKMMGLPVERQGRPWGTWENAKKYGHKCIRVCVSNSRIGGQSA